MQLQDSLDHLGEAVRSLAHAVHGNATGVTKEDLHNMEARIMSKLTDWAAQEEADLSAISATLDGVVAGVANLNKLITDFQNSPGTLSADDQAALDRIQAASKTLVDKAASIKTDAPTPPTAPA